MKNYTITVNGNVYDVVVEEGRRAHAPAPVAAAPVAAPAPAAASAPAPAAAPVATPVPAPAPTASGTAGSVRIEAGAAGKVCRIEAPVGTAVKSGDPVVIVEAMKMEIPMVSPADGTIASINVNIGDMVEGGALLATLN
jgi:biotin carboxyl carrier protein